MYRYDDGANRSGEHPDDQWSVQIIEEVHGSQESHQRVKSTCFVRDFVRNLTCGFRDVNKNICLRETRERILARIIF